MVQGAIVQPGADGPKVGLSMNAIDPLRCPRCESDQIRKVSAVVLERTASETSEFSTYGDLTAQYNAVTVHVELVEMLRMPPIPAVSTSPGAESAMGCGVTIAATIVLWIILAQINAPNSFVGPFLIIMFRVRLFWGDAV